MEVWRRATASGAMEKGGYVRVIEEKEIKGDNPIQIFLLHKDRKYLLSLRGGDGS